jgi:RNA polymerase sigma-70 factor (ECF subfamily)
MDAEHFKRIFLPYHRKLYGMACRLLGNSADAEDMVQETYIKLWQKRMEMDSILSPEGFAVRLLKNSCVDFLRKNRPDGAPLGETLVAESLAERVELRDQLQHVQRIMEQLPLQQQQVVALKVWHNLSNEEIEQRTGLKQGNIKMLISRAKRAIRDQYLKWEKYEDG